MTAKQFQDQIREKLRVHFGQTVVVEWPISRAATDVFARNTERYSPRVDVAVNTLGSSPGNHRGEIENFWRKKAPKKLRVRFTRLMKNFNPRCSLAIEVVFSGSSKHILGDITNASMMGLYGIVIPSFKMTAKVNRIFKYVKVLRDIGKAPEVLFQNVLIIPQREFLELIS